MPKRDRTAQAVHSRIYRRRGYAREHLCIACFGPALDWAYLYAAGKREKVTVSGQRYSEDIEDYAPMCRPCHWRLDSQNDPGLAARRAEGTLKGDKSAGGRATAAKANRDPAWAAKRRALGAELARRRNGRKVAA